MDYINSYQKSTITREFLSNAIKREMGININKASTLVDYIVRYMIEHISSGNTIKIRLFGTFTTRSKAARVGRNPKTMESAAIPAREVVKFKVAPKLKKKINDNINLVL